MNGLDKAECQNCEIAIDRIKAEGRGWTTIVSRYPADETPQESGYIILMYYYCDTCWQQQQSRMFG